MDDTQKPPPPVPEEGESPLRCLPGAEAYASAEPDTTVLPAGAPPANLAAQREGSWPLPAVERQRFLVDGVVAQGGHGRILRAQDRQLERTVALKELLAPGSSAEARFFNEARVTARLQHPSIVPVYEAGRWPGGEPFYTMKLVSGRSLARLIDSAPGFRARLELLPHVLAVAEAVAYAHSRRVVHRDLKPSNILVGEFGETIVIDWGLAKELDRQPAREPAPEPRAPQPPAEELPWVTESGAPAPPVSPPGPEDTEAGTVLGTPAYMPLEQASGQPVDERADVYALGSILYHVLAGRPPYSGSSSQEVLGLVLSGPPPPLEQVQPGVPRELLGIVSRAMAREPARRYPSARELAEDMRRFQTGQLVGAHQYSPWELLARFVRQHAVALGMAAVALLALATGLGLNYLSVLRERDRAERKQAEAEHAWHQATERADMLTLLQARAALEHSPERALAWLKDLSPSFTAWGRARTLAADALARGLATRLPGHAAALNCAAFSPNGRWLLTTSDDRTARLWELASGQSRVLDTLGDEAWYCAFSPQGHYAAASGKDGTVRLWELATGRGQVLRGPGSAVPLFSFSPEGERLFAGSIEGQVWEWELASGHGRALGSVGSWVTGLSLLPGGRSLVATGTHSPHVWRWDLESGQARRLGPHTHALRAVAASARGSALAAGGLDGSVLLWERPEGRARTLEVLPARPCSLTFSREGRYLAVQHQGGPLRLWDLQSGQVRTLEAETCLRNTLAVAFSPRGRWLAAAGRNGRTRLWELATGRSRLLQGTEASLGAVAFSEDEQWLATAGHDGLARLYAVEPRGERVLATHQGPVLAAGFSADGRHVLSAGREDGQLLIASLEGGAPVQVQAHPGGLTAAQVLAGGSRLATAGREGTVGLWDDSGRLLRRLSGPAQEVRVLAISRDGARVAAGDASGEVWLWEAGSGEGRRLGRHEQAVQALAFCPRGRLLASGGKDRTLRLWDLEHGTERLVHRHQQQVTSVAFSPQGRHLLSGSHDHTLWLQPLDSGEGRKLEVGGAGVLQVAFSPDGGQVLSTSAGERALRRWDVEEGRFLEELRGQGDVLLTLAPSPEGQRVVAGSGDGAVWLWDVESGESRPLPGHVGAVLTVAFSPDGQHLLSAGEDGTVRLWRDDLPLEPQPLRKRLAELAGP